MDTAISNNQLRIALNFLPLDSQEFSFTVYRKPVSEDTQAKSLSPDVRRYKLPEDPAATDGEYKEYLVSLNTLPDYQPFVATQSTNNLLTLYLVLKKLYEKCSNVLGASNVSINERFKHSVEIVTSRCDVGNETIWLKPYFLRKTKQMGVLIGYHFRISDGQPLDRQVLQKSLSLGSDGRENKNYYADNYGKLEGFVLRYRSQLFPLQLDNQSAVTISWPPQVLNAEILDTKSYVFAEGMRESSQFQGIRKHGPLQPIKDDPLICFMYRAQDKRLAHDLYYSLKGEKHATFPGMKAMFAFPLEKRHFVGLPVDGYEIDDMQCAIDSLGSRAENRAILPLILFPWSRQVPTSEGEDHYYTIKHWFLTKKIPTQFVSHQRISDRDGLKWSIGNIGLAVFAKLGGIPWKLVPRKQRCLIIGIGQAHRKVGEVISRYFAYSVLSDSSGLYDSIRVLSKSKDESQYLHGLTEQIKSVIAEFSDRYEEFALHTPFKLRKDETYAINQALSTLNGGKRVVVLRFNDNSKYFGFATWHNSMVPYESSCVALGKNQYLVWFEGLQYHNPTVKRRISRPMHIEFAYPDNLTPEQELEYLQDALNLSGANWRGFNAKTLPVSVYYAKLIAQYIGHFDRLDLPEIDIEDLPPWFL